MVQQEKRGDDDRRLHLFFDLCSCLFFFYLSVIVGIASSSYENALNGVTDHPLWESWMEAVRPSVSVTVVDEYVVRLTSHADREKHFVFCAVESSKDYSRMSTNNTASFYQKQNTYKVLFHLFHVSWKRRYMAHIYNH
jgi:hypothetical protein